VCSVSYFSCFHKQTQGITDYFKQKHINITLFIICDKIVAKKGIILIIFVPVKIFWKFE